MKKSHEWFCEEIYEAEIQCPYCREIFFETCYAEFEEGRIIVCHKCNKPFELGKQN